MHISLAFTNNKNRQALARNFLKTQWDGGRHLCRIENKILSFEERKMLDRLTYRNKENLDLIAHRNLHPVLRKDFSAGRSLSMCYDNAL